MIKNIWVYGMGGVGGHFGGRLARALKAQSSECRVFFIARGTHLEEMRAHGLRLVWPGGREEICVPALATDNTSQLPAPDLCLLCVKSYDLEDAVRDIAQKAKDDTIVMPFLNGVTICERIRKIYKTGFVLPSCVFVVALKSADGVISCPSGEGVLFSGRDPEFPEHDFSELRELFDKTDIELRWKDSSVPLIWQKYAFIASFALVTAAFGKTFGQVMSDPDLKGLVVGILHEIEELAKKRGIDMETDVTSWALLNASKLSPSTTTSFQRDVSGGVQAEDDIFTTDLLALARESGVEMKVCSKVIEVLAKQRAK